MSNRLAVIMPVTEIKIGHRIAPIGSSRFHTVENVTPHPCGLHINGRNVVSVTTVTGPSGTPVKQRTIFDGTRGGECWDFTGFCMREITDAEDEEMQMTGEIPFYPATENLE